MSDYYKTLEVDKNASQDEIKKSFRRLAQKYHPDKSTGDESKFKEINEAYETLSDPEKRKSYDFGNQGGFHQQGFSGFEDMFNNIFGQHHNPFHRNHGSSSARSPLGFGSLDHEIALELTLAEAYKGTKRLLKYKSKSYCASCSGFGGSLSSCKGCNGSGMRTQKQGFMVINSTCNLCQGFGQVKDNSGSCKPCNGLGYSLENQEFDLDIPAGSGHIEAPLRLSIQGRGSKFNNQKGSLVLNITLKKQNRFRQDGLNLLTKQKINFTDLVLGTNLEVELPDQTKTKIKLEPKTNLSESYVVKKMGMPQPGSGYRGDLIVGFEFIIPDSLTSEQESLLRQLKQSGL